MPFSSDNAAVQNALDIIAEAIAHQPRSLQKRIGPSEVGTECTHCLAAKLAGWEKTPDANIPWASTVGTALHELMASIFEACETSEPGRWKAEQRVSIGTIAGTEVTGTCDLFDTHTGTVMDFKFLGDHSLRTARKAPKPQYRTQLHAYGRGYTRAGYQVNTVALLQFPRTKSTLKDTCIWHQPYDETVALHALANCDRIAKTLDALAQLGGGARDGWITTLDRAEGCFDCPRYPDWNGPARMDWQSERQPTITNFFTTKSA